MTDATPAGWYPDATIPGQQRWWDGTQWTEHVQAPYVAGSAYAALKAPEGTSPQTIHIWLIVGLFALQGIASILWLATFDWAGYMDASMSVGLGGAYSNPYAMMFTPSYFALIALSFVSYGLTALLAYFDSKALQARGVQRPFHWAFNFIPSWGSVVYVIGRSIVARRRTGSGTSPMWAYIAVFAVVLIATLVVTFAGMASMFSDIPSYSDYGTYGE